MLYFFLNKKAAWHIGIDGNLNGRHARGFKTDNAASVRISLFIGNIEMLAKETIDVRHILFGVVSHVVCPENQNLLKI